MEFSIDDNIYYFEKKEIVEEIEEKGKKVKKKITVDDESGASIKYRTLSIKDYQKIIKFIGKPSGSGDAAAKGLAMLSDDSFLTLCSDIVPIYCTDLKNIVLSENNQKRNATVEDLLRFGVFTNFLMSILTTLISSSEVKSKEEIEVKK